VHEVRAEGQATRRRFDIPALDVRHRRAVAAVGEVAHRQLEETHRSSSVVFGDEDGIEKRCRLVFDERVRFAQQIFGVGMRPEARAHSGPHFDVARFERTDHERRPMILRTYVSGAVRVRTSET